jgi:hypothetical protein
MAADERDDLVNQPEAPLPEPPQDPSALEQFEEFEEASHKMLVPDVPEDAEAREGLLEAPRSIDPAPPETPQVDGEEPEVAPAVPEVADAPEGHAEALGSGLTGLADLAGPDQPPSAEGDAAIEPATPAPDVVPGEPDVPPDASEAPALGDMLDRIAEWGEQTKQEEADAKGEERQPFAGIPVEVGDELFPERGPQEMQAEHEAALRDAQRDIGRSIVDHLSASTEYLIEDSQRIDALTKKLIRSRR